MILFILPRVFRLFDARNKVWVLNSDGLDLSVSLCVASLVGVVVWSQAGKGRLFCHNFLICKPLL